MPRPQNKEGLLKAANENYAKLIEAISGLSDEERNTPFDFSGDAGKKEAHWGRDKNVRDVIMHLYEWHQLMIGFVTNNAHVQDKKSSIAFLPPDYSWKTYGAMNMMFWNRNQDITEKAALKKLEASHNKVMALIERFSDEELFTKKYFVWVGNAALGSFFISNTSSHYDWALKKLKAHKKRIASQNKK